MPKPTADVNPLSGETWHEFSAPASGSANAAQRIHVALAVAVLTAAGIAGRALDQRSSLAPGQFQVGMLRGIPATIDAWTGTDTPLHEAVLQTADADDYLCRTYADRSASAVTLYIADGIRARDLLPHRPEVCYPAAGWMLASADPVQLPGGQEAILYSFERGGLDGRSVAVLSFFVIDGQVTPTLDRLRFALRGAPRRVQQVQITCPGDPAFPSHAAERVRNFAQRATPALLSVLVPSERESG
jgi:EpsI family protein